MFGFHVLLCLAVAGADTDVVILTGGSETSTPGSETSTPLHSTSVEVFDPLGRCQVQLPQLPVPRLVHSSHYTQDGRLLLCGGWNAFGSSGRSSCIHWVDGTFQHHSQLLEGRGAHAGVTMGQHIYLAGGVNITNANVNGTVIHGDSSMESLSGGKTWAREVDIPQGRDNACGVKTTRSTFMVMGGLDDDGAQLSSVEEYNIDTGTWRSRAAMPEWGRFGHSCVNIGGGQVLVAGGLDVDDDWLDSALLYRVDNDTWSTAARMNQKKCCGELVVINGRILYMGGEAGNVNVVDTIEEYDPEADSWTILDTRLNTPRYWFGASVVPRSLVGC